MTHLSDELLLAYLDGQIEKTQASSVAQLAANNAEVSRRLARLRRTQAQLSETFGAFAREQHAIPASVFASDAPPLAPKPLPTGLRADVRPVSAAPTQTPKSMMRQAIFVSAVFVGGLIGGYGATLFSSKQVPTEPKIIERQTAQPALPSGWMGDLARFHAFFPRETLTPHNDAISNPELIGFQLTKVTARAITPPDFSRQGYTLFRGQLFHYNQEKMMQLTFASKTEPPLTFYVLPASGTADAPISAHALGSNRGVSWVQDRVRYFLTADKNEQDLKMLALTAQSQMPRRG